MGTRSTEPEALRPSDSSERAELLALYKHALDEYRAQVALGWDRQKFFVGLPLAITSLVAGLLKLNPSSELRVMLAGPLFLSAITAALGIVVVVRGHDYYRATRTSFQKYERLLGLDERGLTVATTEGMQPSPSRRWLPKVYVAVIGTLALFGAADLAGAAYLVIEM